MTRLPVPELCKEPDDAPEADSKYAPGMEMARLSGQIINYAAFRPKIEVYTHTTIHTHAHKYTLLSLDSNFRSAL